MNTQKRGFLKTEKGWATCILTGLLVFGLYGIFIKVFQSRISPFTFLCAFQAVGLLAWWIAYFAIGHDWGWKMTDKEKLYLFLFAFVALGNDLSFFYAMKLTKIANAVLAHQMVSLAMVFLAPLFLGEKRRGKELISLAISIFGLAIIYLGADRSGGTSDFWGITLGLISAVFLAFLIIFYKLLDKGGMSLSKMNTYRFLGSMFLLLPLTQIKELEFGFKAEGGDLSVLLVFGFLFAFVASGIHNYGISRARGMVSTILGKMEPVIAAIYAWWLLGEEVPITTLIGGIIIVGSSIWLAFGQAKEE